MARLNRDFFTRDVLQVAPDLIGQQIMVHNPHTANLILACITEVEAYRGEDDLACHASKGRTVRTEVMYGDAGHLYVYLIYGMYWMLNIITGQPNQPQGVLIRGIQGVSGPGRVSRHLGIDKSFYGEDITQSPRIWLEKSQHLTPKTEHLITTPRIGVDYAKEWAKKPWRWVLLPGESET